MSEFLEQFVIESREYVEQATNDLLTLEKQPTDKLSLDGVFRAFHTLKGSAGIVDFTAMADAVHAVEDVLSRVRTGADAITPDIVRDCVACLDQVSRWLDVIERTGELPSDAAAQTADLVARLASGHELVVGVAPNVSQAVPAWAETLLRKHEHLRHFAATAIRYSPHAEAFFEGEDPVARVAGLPGLLCVDAGPQIPWPSLPDLDPFICNIVISALTEDSPAEVNSAFASVADRCEILALRNSGRVGADAGLSEQARAMLTAQVALIDDVRPDGAANRVASAAAVAENVLRSVGRPRDAAAIKAIARASGSDPEKLREAIEKFLGEGVRAEPVPSVANEHAMARVLRVDAARIDELVNVTGQLTVAKNAIGELTKKWEEGDQVSGAALRQRHAVLDSLVGELQRIVLGTRVLPLRHVFHRLPRLVREIAAATGKPAELLIEGAETEADKAVVEMLFEPLLHLLRNAIDHGVEPATLRAARNKPSIATIVLRAVRVADHVMIEVRDDGGGIDLDRIRSVALARNIIDEETLRTLSDEQVMQMIFEPSFSTADQVSGISGRGVGMDAVRTAVQRIGGQADVESDTGRGTTVRLTMPFSVMMTRVMVVTARGQSFGIPVDAVVETVRVNTASIAAVGSAKAIVLRNRTIPVVDLADVLKLDEAEEKATHATLVVVKNHGTFAAVRVEGVEDSVNVMLKPMEGLLAGTPGVAGSSLLGDGSILLVLDTAELLQ